MPREAEVEEVSLLAVLAIVSAGVSWLLLFVGLFFNNGNLVAASLVGAVAGTILGLVAHDQVGKSAGRISGRGLALAAIVLGLVHVGGWLLLPLLALLFCWPNAWVVAPDCTCQASSHPPEPCCCCAPGGSGAAGSGGCCGDCCGCGACGDCGCGGCGGGCGGCGGCGCGGGCCAVLAPRVDVPNGSPGKASWRHALAHHPDHAAFAADVYRVAGARLCIGCFTTFPLFLLATGLLVALPPQAPWWVLALVGSGLALAQVVSSAGLAKKKWMKVVVKASLGVGMALLVRGVLDGPLAPLQQAGVLLALLGLAALSALPRRARIRKALA